MGRMFEAKCTSCQHSFNACDGGTASAESLRCTQCSESQNVEYAEIPDTFLGFLKGLQTSMPELNGADWRTFDGPPITEDEYRRAVEVKAGNCACGGRFAFDMPVRCPACRSDAVIDLGTFMRYD
jgi:hypothetical protein